MASFRRIALSALLAGVVAGLLMTLVQWQAVVPLILEAERYETSAGGRDADAPHAHAQRDAHDARSHHDVHDSTDTPLERNLYTGVVTVLMAVGYGLLLGACLARLRQAGWRTGLMLGLAGFCIFQLAPALGLPPLPPGAPAADLTPRQYWWIGTAAATAAGLALAYCAYRRKSPLAWLLGAALLAAPHLIGAPLPPAEPNPVPAALLRDFAVASMAAAAFFWLVLGAVQGYVFERLGRAAR